MRYRTFVNAACIFAILLGMQFFQIGIPVVDEVNPPPWACLIPMVMVGVGIAVAVYYGETVPPEWQEVKWKNLGYSKGLILQSAIVFWCVGVVIRGKRLHCGGIVDREGTDIFKYQILLPAMIVGLIVAVRGYESANESVFVGSMVLTIIVACSEIGWGRPFYIVSGFWD